MLFNLCGDLKQVHYQGQAAWVQIRLILNLITFDSGMEETTFLSRQIRRKRYFPCRFFSHIPVFRLFCCFFLRRRWQANMSLSIRHQSMIHTGDALVSTQVVTWIFFFHSSCHLNVSFSSRENTMMSATAVFNLMSLACARSGHYKVVTCSSVKTFKYKRSQVVTDMFERSLRFCPKVSYQCFQENIEKDNCFLISVSQHCSMFSGKCHQEDHVWSGLALSLACEGRHLRALVLLKEVRIGFGKFPLAS